MDTTIEHDVSDAGGEELYREVRRRIAPQRVREWSRLRPWIAVRDSALCWLLIVAAWILVAVHLDVWTVLVAMVVVGNRYYGLFIIGHDALHRRVIAGSYWNDLFSDLVIFGPIGAITRINNKNHLTHHRRLAHSDDPDRHKYGCFNKATLLALLGYSTGLSSVVRSVWNVFVGRPAVKGSDASKKMGIPYSLRDVLIILAWQAALFGGLTWFIGWWAYFLLWWIPVYVFAFLGDNLRSFLEHSQPKNDADADAHRLISYRAPWWETMWIAPFCMNYHATHHFFPSIPYYNLAVADREIRPVAESLGAEWRTSYLAYLWRYARRLPLEECRFKLPT